ncbi:hypothetical protein [Paenibacillus aceris]|uniref:Uncharacterized protein n=1 Tax=Paenibacillus aceris TaxID=869555 RepID=A0ABS4I444_9BACL|nr:hypothetical protein [Paenibacillus aceris]MBP1965580.1 hypothetical protein [Paenibacillus aceris]NHW38481.1 hypothetical protein [Paenibacillus aceris]
MFKNKTHVLMLLISLTLLTAFSKQDPFIVRSVETNVLKTAGVLRYDIVLKKSKDLKLDYDAGDSPGHRMFHHGNGINFAIRPNQSLASLMELEKNTKYVKMEYRGGGNSGNISGEDETTLNLEYAIKKGSDFEEVRNSALDSTLLILMGNKVIAEIPLNKKE